MSNDLNKIHLIYILSSGRSGSTLLDMLIGNHVNCYTLGEFQVLPIDFKHNTQPCGCGKNVAKCDFWEEICDKNIGIINNGTISKFRNFGFGKVLRWKEISEIFVGRCANFSDVKTYGNDNYKVLQSVLSSLGDSNVKYLVDASKDPYRLKWLAQSNMFDIKVLHIIKKPEAFVYSMSKQENSFFRKTSIILRMSVRWGVENLIGYRVGQKYINKDGYKKIRYEDLASNTNKELNSIFDFLGLEPNELSDSLTFKHANHAISGNEMRFKSGDIKLDEQWKSKMTMFHKLIVKMITLFFQGIYK